MHYEHRGLSNNDINLDLSVAITINVYAMLYLERRGERMHGITIFHRLEDICAVVFRVLAKYSSFSVSSNCFMSQ